MIDKNMLLTITEKEASTQIKIENSLSLDNNNNKNKIPSSRAEEKYGLRPRTIIKRLQQEKTRQELPKKPQRSKSRPAPLSKYRRKTANARERHRMREINNAFESLRKALPDAYETRVSNAMTKITTLKLAVQYIQTLSRVLDDASDDNFYSLDASSVQENNIKHHYESTVGHVNDGSSSFQMPSSQCYIHSTLPLSNSSSSSRGSLSSASDLEEFLSDDSALLEDNLDVFHDIPALPGPDPFELLLDQGRENLIFAPDFCSFK